MATQKQDHAGTTFDKRSVYHSALAAATRNEGLWIRLTSTVQPSKNKQSPGFVNFEVNEDPGKYFYNVENHRIKAHLGLLKQGEWYNISASGRDEDAFLDIVDGNGEPVEEGAQQEPAPKPAPSGRPAPAPGTRSAAPAPKQQASLQRVLRACLAVAHDLDAAYTEHYGEPMNENVRSIAISLAIAVHRGDGPLTDPK